jgi:HEAT repeat protein
MNVEQRETMDSLINGLNSENIQIRKKAIGNAVNSTDDEVVERLIQLIQESDVGPDSREAAAIALAQMPSERSGEFLLHLICSDDPGLRGIATLGLGHLQSEASMSALIKALADEVNTVRNLAERSLLIMVEVVREKGVEQLLELLSHPVSLTRSPAARVIGRTRDPRALDPLLNTLQTDPQWLARLWSAKALGDLGMTEAFDALAEALKSDEKNRVRAAAAEAIGKLKAPKSAELLKLALMDADGGVRKIAEESLSTLGMTGFENDDDPFADA